MTGIFIRLSDKYWVSIQEQDQFRRFLLGKPIAASEIEAFKRKGYLDTYGKPVPEFLELFQAKCPPAVQKKKD